MRSIGIDIGSYSIKVAEIDGQGRSATIRDFKETQLSHEPGQDTKLEKIEILRRICAQYDPTQYRYCVGIGSEFTTSRILTFPFLDRRKILQSIPFELEDVIPLSQNDFIYDFRAIAQMPASTRILAVAAPKKNLADILNLCDDAGFSPDVVCPDGIALANHFIDFEQIPKAPEQDSTVVGAGAQLILHIGYSTTLVNLIHNDALVASRAIFFGGKDLTKAISRTYQLPYGDALKGVAEKGFVLTSTQGANEDQIAFSQTIAQGLDAFVGDLQRTIVDFKAELTPQIEVGHLMGGMSRLINLGPYLTQHLQIPFGVHSHIGKATQSDIQNNEENDRASAVATGLAIEGIRKPKSPAFNLRRNEFSKQNQTLELFFARFKNIAAMGAALYIAFFIYSFLRPSFTDDNLTALNQALRDFSKKPTIGLTSSQLSNDGLPKAVKAKKEEVEGRKATQLLNQMTSVLDVMKTVTSAVPSKTQAMLDITHLDLEGENLTLDGTVRNQGELDSLKNGLSQLISVSGIKVNPSPASPPGKLAFNATMKIARLPQRSVGNEKESK